MEIADSLPCSPIFSPPYSHPSIFFLYESRPVYLWVYQVVSFLKIFPPIHARISLTSHNHQ